MIGNITTNRDADNVMAWFCLINAFAAPYLAAAVLEALGLGFALKGVAELSLWLKVPVLFVLWALSFVVVGGIALGVLALLYQGAIASLNGMALLADGVTRAGHGLGRAGGVALAFVGHPLRLLWQEGTARLGNRLALVQERLRQAVELRRLYREEFADQFANFADFKNAFEEKARQDEARQEYRQERQGPQGRSNDPFVQACRLLGLPEDGSFTQADLKARYRALIRGVHPDVAGDNGVASEINAAYGFINKFKGWR